MKSVSSPVPIPSNGSRSTSPSQVDTMACTDGLLGSGGAQGELSEFVVIKDAAPGRQLRVVPSEIPWEVAALNEPMAVAYHAVNRTQPKEGDKVVIFGAGPIGLGALLGCRRRGASHIVVVDIAPSRLGKALQMGADAVVSDRVPFDRALDALTLAATPGAADKVSVLFD